MLKRTFTPSRRLTSRIKTPDGVWVIWTCGGREETSRVRDLSLGGLFIETTCRRAVGAEAYIDFLVQEGQIRAEAVVRHVEASSGLGLKFTAINDRDRPHMVSLINRLRSLSA
jgi:c-di-GMP-binding flagellar brake protein YcgR